MDALVIGPPHSLACAVARGLRRHGHATLQAIPADASGPDRIGWLLEEAEQPGLIVVIDSPPFATAHELVAHTNADIVLVAEQRAAMADMSAVPRSYAPCPVGPGLRVVALGRAGLRWFRIGARRAETLSPERAAAIVIRACRLPTPAPAH
jgi:hypothetical protein